MNDMKESALQYTTFGYTQLHHTDIIKVVIPPHSLEVVAEILDCEIEHYEINIEEGDGADTLSELASLKASQYKLMRAHKFGHEAKFTLAELEAMHDAVTNWIVMNEENEVHDQPSNESYYVHIAWNRITRAIRQMGHVPYHMR